MDRTRTRSPWYARILRAGFLIVTVLGALAFRFVPLPFLSL